MTVIGNTTAIIPAFIGNSGERMAASSIWKPNFEITHSIANELTRIYLEQADPPLIASALDLVLKRLVCKICYLTIGKLFHHRS